MKEIEVVDTGGRGISEEEEGEMAQKWRVEEKEG